MLMSCATRALKLMPLPKFDHLIFVLSQNACIIIIDLLSYKFDQTIGTDSNGVKKRTSYWHGRVH